MGDHGGLLPNGLLPSAAAGFVARVLDPERWAKAEERTVELVARIQPTWAAEERRNAVAGYVQRLIMKCFPCKVVTFGSVPLKTYLPDGDIDLTAFSENENMNLKDTWAVEVRNVLESEEKNENAEFHVKEVQYIQAEVKIIKCLVEDIVVDISFDQVGGLCTLCFLNEIDALINQNHLFKRSIILIKAWCYYESRILGAHHGLISTYALETLVLYIFNVYNNSFAGPLEVLYRFLEFFSNFDWEKFCISLWGPIPISSLPDMTSEPPRKDGGELLLSKPFLDLYSTVFAVFPAGHDNQTQPFVSKHFNIIDPLRIRNNLGRSVSKGNFFRIRSAFAFGAKRLARLFECPEETVVAELNQFFTNTWERHGSGNRPDVPSPNLRYLRPTNDVLAKEPDNAWSASSLKKNSDNNVLSSRHKFEANGGLVSHGATSEVLKTVDQNFQSIYRAILPTALYHAQNLEGYGSQVDSEVSDLAGSNTNAIGFAQSHMTQNNFWSDHSMSGHAGLDRFQLARTHSSPELSDTSPEILAIGSCNKVQEPENNHIGPTRFEHVSRRKHMGSDGPSNSRQHLPHRILEAADSSNALINFHDPGRELASVSETLEMHQEEQDLVNMMASLHNVNGQIQLPIHFPSHIPFQLSPSVVASIAYNQRSLTGTVPLDIPLIDPSWVSNMQYPQGLVSPHIPHYHPTAGPSFNSDDVTGSVNGNSGMAGVSSDNGDQVFWHGDDGGSNRSDSDNGGQLLNIDDKKHLRGSPTVLSSSRASNSGASSVREHHKVARESKRLVSEDDTGAIRYQTNKYSDSHSNTGNRNLGSFPISSDISSRRKSASESSSDGSEKAPKSAKDKRGRRLAATAILTALYGNSRNGRQLDASSDRSSARADDEVSSHAKNNQLPASEPSELRRSDSVVPIAPMLVNTSQQRVVENPGVVPYAFYPTGPPVPFLTMLPVYNFPSDTSGSDGSTSHYDSDERLHPGATSRDGQNFDSAESLSQSEINMSSSSLGNSNSEPPEEHKFDILNSDSASHWHNLQYGRSCQNRHHGPIMHPSPMYQPPVYLQGHIPWDGPGRPSPNLNLFTQFMGYGPRRVPVAPLQPGPLRTPVFQHYGEEVPRYRGGTGTYLPNPKFPVRDRSTSNVRNHRANYNHDRNDPDREGSWNNTKSRTAGMVHGRSQMDRASSRPDRSSANDSRTDRQWNGHKHDPLDAYQSPSATFGSRKSSQGSANTTYGVYSMPAANLNGMGPPRPTVPSSVKLYQYDQGVMYGSRAEPLKFGSLGLVQLPGGSEVTEAGDENPVRDGYQQRQGTYRGSSHSSPG